MEALRIFETFVFCLSSLGDYSDEVAELSEETCSEWLSVLNRAKLLSMSSKTFKDIERHSKTRALRLVYFFGEGRGQLELLPFDEDSDAVEIS